MLFVVCIPIFKSISKLKYTTSAVLYFQIIGSVCLGVGIWVVVDGTVFLEVLGKIPEDTSVVGSLIQDAAYILIGGGAAIFLIAFFGCCGAWKKNKCLLIVVSKTRA